MKTYSEFHDGAFNGLLLEGDSAHFFLETTEKEKYVVSAGGLVELRLNNVRKGNVVFDLEVFEFGEITIVDFLEVQSYLTPPQAEIAFQQAHDRKLLLIRLNSSYGADFGAIASSVKVLRQEQSSKF
jgi:hypothetical protein